MKPIEPKWGLSAGELGYPQDELEAVVLPLNKTHLIKTILQEVTQATLRHVYEEGEKGCPHTTGVEAIIRRRECPECWDELKEASCGD